MSKKKENQYRSNHYVPQWYQQRFITPENNDNRYIYYDMYPKLETSPDGFKFTPHQFHRWGAGKCFEIFDLYTTSLNGEISTEIEQFFFGEIDNAAVTIIDSISNYDYKSAYKKELTILLEYMSVQKLRTPKGLMDFSYINKINNKNELLIKMQQYKDMHCATWSECVWCILDASDSDTKFIISDNPVTLYNKKYSPKSIKQLNFLYPDIRLNGTHTLFPLSLDKILVLTNLSWVRNPYTDPMQTRPNPKLFRTTMFNVLEIQTGRKLSEEEVIHINYIIKKNAHKYIAASQKDWLVPEEKMKKTTWDLFGNSYLLMPDPRIISFTTGIFWKGQKRKSYGSVDEYGRYFDDDKEQIENRRKLEMETFDHFIGEYARVFGPKRRGKCIQFHRLTEDIESQETHEYHLSLEKRNSIKKDKNKIKNFKKKIKRK